jgi:ABC-type antimicrobial peptide transport system permease subunit
MITNYLKIALRNLMRNTTFTFINVAGLSLGIASSMLIALWVTKQISYNRFHPNYEQIHQVYFFGNLNGQIGDWKEISYLVYEDLKTNHTAIKNAAVTDLGAFHLLSTSQTRINKRGRFVSPEFLEIFHFGLVRGTPEKALTDPFSIVLTESTAKTLFGTDDPINKIVRIDNGSEVKVTGVVKDVPDNSTIKFDYLLTIELFRNTTPWVKEEICEWDGDGFFIYVELQPGANLASINREIKDLYQDRDKRFLSKELFLYPMDRWKLHAKFENGKEAEVDWSDYVTGFSMLAIGILVIACVNFMNLSTDRSERRAREVGIRKIVGSDRKQLIYQFIGESILLSTVAFFIGLVLVELSLPFYNQLIDEKLFIDYSSPVFWLIGLCLIILTGLLAGSYPAFYLSSFNPATVLKGKLFLGRDGVLPRRFLVIFQFTFSIILIVGTVVIYQQMEYIRNRQLGYDKQNLITIPGNPELGKNYNSIKQELMRTGAALSVTRTSTSFTSKGGRGNLGWPGSHGQVVTSIAMSVDYDFTKTWGIKMEGRDFSESLKADTISVLVNQTAVGQMGLKNPIGTEITVFGSPAKIIGIMDDVLLGSPYEKLRPMYASLETSWTYNDEQFISVRLPGSGDLNESLKNVETVFKKLNPSYPFQFTFADVDYNSKFNSLSLIQKLVSVFAFLAIAIASLGLFGLAAFIAERRTKEFGVRRVLGATIQNLVVMITRDFIRLVLIAIVIASPIAWAGLENFLEHYSVHISMSWWILPATGLMTSTITLIIVGSQIVRTSSVSPSESLKCE